MTTNQIQYFYPPKPTRIWPDSPLVVSFADSLDWIAEIKLNGWRILLFILADSIQIYNSNGSVIDIDHEIFRPHFERFPANTVFDGELLDKRTKTLKNVMVFWDTCFYNGLDVRRKPLKERKQYLKFPIAPLTFVQKPTAQIFKSQQFNDDFLNLYNQTITRNDPLEEGIVIKNLSSTYKHNPKRSIDILDWFKIKKIDDHALVNR